MLQPQTDSVPDRRCQILDAALVCFAKRGFHQTSMQQLNAVTISGVPTGSVDATLKFLEDEAHRILPPGYVIDYTGGSRQLRHEGNTFFGVFMLAVLLIFLVLAAQFNSFRDPLIILLGSVPLALFGAAVFMSV